jgi:glycosyltransferase involved in cell wall biosynthesis
MTGATQVSVIVPTRDRLTLLRRALLSILGQDAVRLEVIVVDDASRDDTVAMIASLDDERIRLVRHDQPRGPTEARNTAIARASSPWIAFCDDDDLWAPGKLAAQLHALSKNPEAEWCSCGAVWVNTDLELIRSFETRPAGNLADQLLAYNALPGSASAIMVSAAGIERVGGFDASISWGEDWDLWIRFALMSPIAIVDRPLVAILAHDRNRSSHDRRFIRDAQLIDRKYQHEREARGVGFNWFNLRGAQAEIELRAGYRWRASGQYLLQAMAGGGLGSLKRAAGACVVPEPMLRRWASRRHDAIPPDWVAEANAWLTGLRARPDQAVGHPAPGRRAEAAATDGGAPVSRPPT